MKKSKFNVKLPTLGNLYDSIDASQEKHKPFGNANSRRILIVPFDEGRGHYFRGQNALTFQHLFEITVGEKIEDHFCIVPAAVHGDKISKAAASPLIEFIQHAQTKFNIEWVIALGGEAFKHVFGKGYKPPMSSLAGNRIHLPKEYGSLNIYVFPEISELFIELQGDKGDYSRERDMKWHQDRMTKILKKYEKEK